jgi:hypothetical protein
MSRAETTGFDASSYEKRPGKFKSETALQQELRALADAARRERQEFEASLRKAVATVRSQAVAPEIPSNRRRHRR